jgi:hypothetical protein
MTLAATIDKALVIQSLLAHIRADIEAITDAQRRTQDSVTHEEARSEHSKDTRATESSYLARGLAERMSQLHEAAAKVAAMRPKQFNEADPIQPGALVILDGPQGSVCYFLAPAGGGVRLEFDSLSVLVVTPEAPIGRALLGKEVDDDVIVKTPKGASTFVVCDIC